MEQNHLNGKVALVTGAAKRIGASIIECLHAAGAKVILHYRCSEAAAVQLAAKLNQQRPDSCYIIQADLLDVERLPDFIQQAVAWAGRLDILVNNASSFYPTPVASVTVAQWDELMGANVKVPFFLTQAALPYLQPTQGCVINISDIHAQRPLQHYSIYSTAKAGLALLTKALALELGPTVRVNGVAPGAILWPEQASTTEQQVSILNKTALKRAGQTEDIAQAVLYLINAPYVTGQILAVDGGRTLNQ